MSLSHSRNGEKKSEDKDGGSFRYTERKHKLNERSETKCRPSWYNRLNYCLIILKKEKTFFFGLNTQ